MGAYTVVRADTHEAAAKLFENHLHFAIFAGESVEIMPGLNRYTATTNRYNVPRSEIGSYHSPTGAVLVYRLPPADRDRLNR